MIHEYKLTSYSLYAAVSVGLQTADIIEYLKRLSKTSIPENVLNFIKESTLTYGKVKLILKQNRYFIETRDEATLKMLLNDPVVKSVLIDQDYTVEGGMGEDGGAYLNKDIDAMASAGGGAKDIYEFYDKLDQDDANAYSKAKVYLLEIKKEEIETLQKR